MSNPGRGYAIWSTIRYRLGETILCSARIMVSIPGGECFSPILISFTRGSIGQMRTDKEPSCNDCKKSWV
jgi:hypothetical protein